MGRLTLPFLFYFPSPNPDPNTALVNMIFPVHLMGNCIPLLVPKQLDGFINVEAEWEE